MRQLFTLVSGWVTGQSGSLLLPSITRECCSSYVASPEKIKVQNLSMVSARCFWFCSIVNLKII